MTRVAAFGSAFAAAIEVLGLEPRGEPEIVLVDLADERAVREAALLPPGIPRVATGGPGHEALLRAAGSAITVARSAEPAVIGPLVAAALPARTRGATRLVTVTGPCGGSGRTLLVAGLAERLAARVAVLVIDASGSGMAGRWLRIDPPPWSDLEGLVHELTTEHLGIVAAERDRLRALGGGGAMPSAALLAATLRESVGIADVVLVDAAPLFDERTRDLVAASDRVLLVATDEPSALAGLEHVADDERTWLIASRCRAGRVGTREVFRSLPDDPGAVRSAARDRSTVRGTLGRAYDDLADLLAIDIS
jgi:Mrp family chromosome partitioning ATPase